MNTGWYVFGTKSELKAQRILDGGKVLQGSFNKGYFTKIDIRVNKEIKLYSKSAHLLTAHPSSSYTLTTDTNGQYVLRITDPQTSGAQASTWLFRLDNHRKQNKKRGILTVRMPLFLCLQIK